MPEARDRTADFFQLQQTGQRVAYAALGLIPVGMGGNEGHAVFHDFRNGLSDGICIVYAPQRME